VRVVWMRESEGLSNSVRVSSLPHCLHANAPFVGKKDENLVRWVFIGCSKEVELVPTANQKEWVQSVLPRANGRESNVLNGTHLVRVQLPELCEVHLDFLVRDLESLANKRNIHKLNRNRI